MVYNSNKENNFAQCAVRKSVAFKAKGRKKQGVTGFRSNKPSTVRYRKRLVYNWVKALARDSGVSAILLIHTPNSKRSSIKTKTYGVLGNKLKKRPCFQLLKKSFYDAVELFERKRKSVEENCNNVVEEVEEEPEVGEEEEIVMETEAINEAMQRMPSHMGTCLDQINNNLDESSSDSEDDDFHIIRQRKIRIDESSNVESGQGDVPLRAGSPIASKSTGQPTVPNPQQMPSKSIKGQQAVYKEPKSVSKELQAVSTMPQSVSNGSEASVSSVTPTASNGQEASVSYVPQAVSIGPEASVSTVPLTVSNGLQESVCNGSPTVSNRQQTASKKSKTMSKSITAPQAVYKGPKIVGKEPQVVYKGPNTAKGLKVATEGEKTKSKVPQAVYKGLNNAPQRKPAIFNGPPIVLQGLQVVSIQQDTLKPAHQAARVMGIDLFPDDGNRQPTTITIPFL